MPGLEWPGSAAGDGTALVEYCTSDCRGYTVYTRRNASLTASSLGMLHHHHRCTPARPTVRRFGRRRGNIYDAVNQSAVHAAKQDRRPGSGDGRPGERREAGRRGSGGLPGWRDGQSGRSLLQQPCPASVAAEA